MYTNCSKTTYITKTALLLLNVTDYTALKNVKKKDKRSLYFVSNNFTKNKLNINVKKLNTLKYFYKNGNIFNDFDVK